MSRRTEDWSREGDAPPPPEPLPVAVARRALPPRPDGRAGRGRGAAAAQSVGVERVVTIGIDLETSRWAVEAAASSDDVFAAVAVHPNETAGGVPTSVLEELAVLAALPGVLAVGETGLDHFRTGEEGHGWQEECFPAAHRAGQGHRPQALVIHDRDAHDDVLRVLDEEGAPERTVFHCFSGDAGAGARRAPSAAS